MKKRTIRISVIGIVIIIILSAILLTVQYYNNFTPIESVAINVINYGEGGDVKTKGSDIFNLKKIITSYDELIEDLKALENLRNKDDNMSNEYFKAKLQDDPLLSKYDEEYFKTHFIFSNASSEKYSGFFSEAPVCEVNKAYLNRNNKLVIQTYIDYNGPISYASPQAIIVHGTLFEMPKEILEKYNLELGDIEFVFVNPSKVLNDPDIDEYDNYPFQFSEKKWYQFWLHR